MLARQVLYYLSHSASPIFAFIACAFGVTSKKLIPRPMSRGLSPVFSSKSFTVSGLRFRLFIHFELIFVYGIISFICMWISRYPNTIY
jgi:hypothetical protein